MLFNIVFCMKCSDLKLKTETWKNISVLLRRESSSVVLKRVCLGFTNKDGTLMKYVAILCCRVTQIVKRLWMKDTSEIRNTSSEAHCDPMTRVRLRHVHRVCDFQGSSSVAQQCVIMQLRPQRRRLSLKSSTAGFTDEAQSFHLSYCPLLYTPAHCTDLLRFQLKNQNTTNKNGLMIEL